MVSKKVPGNWRRCSLSVTRAKAERAFETGNAVLHAKVKTRVIEYIKNEEGELEETRRVVDTTVGRSILSKILPPGLSFDLMNKDLTKKSISALINACYREVGLKETVIFADQLMYTGFAYAARSGASFGVNDMVIPDEKYSIIESAEKEVHEIQEQIVRITLFLTMTL